MTECILIYIKPFLKQVYTQSLFYMHADRLRLEIYQPITQNQKFHGKRALGSNMEIPVNLNRLKSNGTCLAQCISCEHGKLCLPSCFRMQHACFSVLICEDIHHTDKYKSSFLFTWKNVSVHHYAEEGSIFSYHKTYRCQKVIIMLFLYSLGARGKISENK